MAIDSVAALLEVLRQHQLLEPGQFNQLQPELRRYNDPRALAQILMRKNWLTPYQVNQIFQGQAASLVLGQYRLLERIGEGGMGQVFKARHYSMGRIVALKVVRKDRLENEQAVRRFRREIELAGKLTHPNVVRAFDADQIAGTHFFAMEYVDGIDLAHLVRQSGQLPVAQACDFIRQAALGLQHAHEVGLVHRDIKSSNLVLTQGETSQSGTGARLLASRGLKAGVDKPLIKILDMGLARPALAAEVESITISQDGTVMGTPDYMAPEQGKNSSTVDWRADIYSLGCTLYFLLTGRVPFPGGSNIEKLIHHQMDEPMPIEQLRSDVPSGVRGIVQAMMAKRPEQRIQSAGEVARLLAPWCETSANAPPASTPRSIKQTQPLPIPILVKAAAAPANQESSLTVRVSSTLFLLRGLLVDPATHRVRRLGVLILAVVLIGLLGMFLVVLSLVAGLASSIKAPTAVAACIRPVHASMNQPT